MRRPYFQGQEPWRLLPRPYYDEGTGRYTPIWNSVLLFFNINFTSPNSRFSGYSDTTPTNAREMLDEINPGSPSVSEFMTNYWAKLSYGQFGFGLNTPRDSSNNPIIPPISQPSNQGNWFEPVNACIDAHAEAIWRAAGSLMTDNNSKRWIPSIVLVQHYDVQASAVYRGSNRTVAGQEYVIGDNTHIGYDLTFLTSQDIPSIPTGQRVRRFLGVLCHELAHNFFEFDDLYGPSGCTGYWDLLGSCSPPGNMSEVSSVHKELIGWLDDQHRIQVVSGPSFANTSLSLRPYTTTGNAIKVIPDPQHNPSEYFILEHRTNTANDLWVPDRALLQGGLLITHINERLGGIPDTWIMRDSPYFDPEFADYLDYGGSMWTDNFRLRGVLFPYSHIVRRVDKNSDQIVETTVVENSFTEATRPSSNFYGDRPSGMRITDITLRDDQIHFQLSINCEPHVGWTVGDYDRYLSGRFTPESHGNPQEIIAYNNRSIALLECRQVHWFVRGRQDDSIDGWSLDPHDYHIVVDVDGDGIDEIYIRSPQWAGILKWQDTAFRLVTAAQDQIGEWRFTPDNRELVANLDADDKTEIYIRSPGYAGVIKFMGGQLQLVSIQDGQIDDWNLTADDNELVGRFTQLQHDEILIRSPRGLGLIYWDGAQSRLRIRHIQEGWIDGWNLSVNDRLFIGDFDGDRFHEIYIRSPDHAGIIKWRQDRFVTIWMRRSNIQYARNNQTLGLTGQDISITGHFLPNRDGILHIEGENGVAILTLEGGEIKVRSYKDRLFLDQLGINRNLWTLSRNDKFLLGNFNRVIRRFPRREDTNLQDQLTNVFMYNNQALGMFGFDRPSNDATNPAQGEDYISLMWVSGSLTSVSGREILFREPI